MISLKNFKFSERNSIDSNNFEAVLLINGQVAGQADNDGWGGTTNVHWNTEAFKAEAESFVAAQPPEDLDGELFAVTIEDIVDDLVYAAVQLKDLKVKFRTRILYTRKDIDGVFMTKALKKDVKNRLLADPAGMIERQNISQILNTLSDADAMAIWSNS